MQERLKRGAKPSTLPQGLSLRWCPGARLLQRRRRRKAFCFQPPEGLIESASAYGDPQSLCLISERKDSHETCADHCRLARNRIWACAGISVTRLACHRHDANAVGRTCRIEPGCRRRTAENRIIGGHIRRADSCFGIAVEKPKLRSAVPQSWHHG